MIGSSSMSRRLPGPRLRLAVLITATALGACAPASEHEPQPVCIDDGDEEGPPCSEGISTDGEFDTLSVVVAWRRDLERLAKYVVPARDDPDLLPPLVQNVNRYPVHQDFLANVFPDRFGDLDLGTYGGLVLQRATRDYYAGNVGRFVLPGGETFYGFTIYTGFAATEQLEPPEVRVVHEALRGVLPDPDPAYTFEPYDGRGPLTAHNWFEPGFPVYFPNLGEVEVEVYTAGEGYGWLRFYAVEEVESAIAAGAVDWRDILVIAGVPFDIDAVVSGVVTGGRQWELSHVNVRMARRGTPNLFVREPHSALHAYRDQLVHLEVFRGAVAGGDRYRITPATTQAAQAFWDARRPQIDSIVPADRAQRQLLALEDMEADDSARPLIAQYGGKAANLANLYQVWPQEYDRYRVPAFGVPLAWFEAFLDANTIVDQRPSNTGGPDTVSLRTYVARLAADPRMADDAAYRHETLWDLRQRMVWSTQLDAALIESLHHRIVEVFGDARVKVRFRSSSNVEDELEFSGAGLYDSTSVCAADSVDGERDGPSWCDPTQNEERTLERGLRKVWASLYNARAWDERAWYGVPQSLASMGVLVTLAFSDERANGVAFTGNANDPLDDRYLVNAQIGDHSVVGNDARVVPEKDLLRIVDGGVAQISRLRGSALVSPGERVVTDDVLGELGALMALSRSLYPIDPGGWEPDRILLDFEFKVDQAGQLRIKQVRPFLDKCRGVVCRSAPEPVCIDEATRLTYVNNGVCDPATGDCRYEERAESCARECIDGNCG